MFEMQVNTCVPEKVSGCLESSYCRKIPIDDASHLNDYKIRYSSLFTK